QIGKFFPETAIYRGRGFACNGLGGSWKRPREIPPDRPPHSAYQGQDLMWVLGSEIGLKRIGKPDSVMASNDATAIIHLALRLLAGSSDLTRGLWADHPTLLFGLAPGGVCHAPAITGGPVSSYLAFSPLPACAGGMFSVVLSPDHSGPPLAATPSYGVRTFLSLAGAIARSALARNSILILPARLVYPAVGKLVGDLVLLAVDVPDAMRVEAAQKLLRLFMQLDQPRLSDAVNAGELAHEQLRIALDAQLRDAQFDRLFEAHQEPRVLGDVVGGFTQIARELAHGLAVGIEDDRAAAGLAGIAARSAVDHQQPFPCGSVRHGVTRACRLWVPRVCSRGCGGSSGRG